MGGTWPRALQLSIMLERNCPFTLPLALCPADPRLNSLGNRSQLPATPFLRAHSRSQSFSKRPPLPGSPNSAGLGCTQTFSSSAAVPRPSCGFSSPPPSSPLLVGRLSLFTSRAPPTPALWTHRTLLLYICGEAEDPRKGTAQLLAGSASISQSPSPDLCLPPNLSDQSRWGSD